MSAGILFRTLAAPIVFAVVALGFHFFLRGHNAPGGGFIAGLLVAAAALLLRMARGHGLTTFPARRIVPWGLLLALATGVVPMAFGYGFLKSAYGYLTWPVIGEFEWASAVAFDLGVFLVVVGVTVTIIDLLAEEAGPPRLGEDRDPGFAGGGDGSEEAD